MRHKTLAILTFIGMFSVCLFLISVVEAQRSGSAKATATQKSKRLPPKGPKTPPVEELLITCCGSKPQLKQIPNYSSSTYASFTGRVAVTTMRADNASGSSVVIWDLKDQATAPVGMAWNGVVSPPTNFYFHSDWTKGKLGDVFGLTLDNSGNIYVATTRVFGTTFMGSPTVLPGSPGRGDIYKLDGNTGVVTRFVQTINNSTYQSSAPNKIPNTGPGIGNIHYSCDYDKFYASNFEDGMIYRIDASGNILSHWDHGHNLPTATPAAAALDDTDVIANNPSAPFTQLGRRPWAVQVYSGRLYYSIWGEHGSGSGGVPNDPPNEIWSIGLDSTGNFTGSAKREIVMGPLNPPNWDFSNPTADISFNSAGKMLLAERTMGSNTSTGAGFSRLLEYQWNGSSWAQPVPNKYQVGQYGGFGSAAGGGDYDQGSAGRVWVTGDALGTATPISGLQGLPVSGGAFSNSILIDVDNNIIQGDKDRAGDVEIPCSPCETGPPKPKIAGPDSTCTTGQYCTKKALGVSYSWSVTGGTAGSVSANSSCITIAWGSTPGKSVTVTATDAAGCTSTTTLVIKDCSDPCCPPWNQALLGKVMVYKGSGSFAAPYTLEFQASPAWGNQMQAYINYLHSLNPAINAITIDWRLHNQGTGASPISFYGPQIGPTVYTTWNTTTGGNPIVTHANFFNLPTAYPMQVGTWYQVHTGIYLEDGQQFFPSQCANNEIYFRRTLFKSAASSNQVLEFKDGKKIISRVPIK